MSMSSEETLTLRVQVQLQQKNYGSGSFHLSEDVEIPVSGFLEVCQVLGQFHTLIETFKRRRVTTEESPR